MVQLLKAAQEGVTGPAVNVRGILGPASRVRAWGSNSDGTWTGAVVSLLGSLTTQGDDWVEIDTIASGGDDILIDYPYERLRADTNGTDSGATTVDVYLEGEKELAF